MKAQIKLIKFFTWVIQQYKIILVVGLVLIVGMGFFLPKITKDTTATAFIPKNNPVLVYREKVKEIFGLQDPIVVAVYNEKGIFNKESLLLIAKLSEELKTFNGIDSDKIRSIATEKNILGTFDGMEVDYFYDIDNFSESTPEKVKKALKDFDLYQGNLVSEDDKLALIVCELKNIKEVNFAARVYNDILNYTKGISSGDNEIHVAGEGAIVDYMTAYIDKDARQLNPMAAIIITFVLIIAYRTTKGAIIPNILVGATVVISLGLMAILKVPFFVITNALPVVLIVIAVADSIHILGHYYETIRDNPEFSTEKAIVNTMVSMWRPVLITSITTIAGFIGVSFSSLMPPFWYFGIFAAIGVSIALIYSFFFIPAILMIGKNKQSPALGKKEYPDIFSKMIRLLGEKVISKPYFAILFILVIMIVGIFGTTRLQVNGAGIYYFQQKEPIVIADKLINKHTHGTSFLDIVVETAEIEGLFKPENLKKIENLQRWIVNLPYVNGSTSIVDLIKKMNQSLHENRKEEYKIPDNELLIAQEFFLYSASGEPTDFENFVDYDYQTANVRVAMSSPLFQDKKIVMEALKEYIHSTFNDEGIIANLSGNVALDYDWINELFKNHFIGLAIAIALILTVSSISFKSIHAGLFAILPVLVSVLLIYAVMGFFNIWLDVGTNMFAVIAMGVGVDFAIHTVDRLIYYIKDQQVEFKIAFILFYKSTGRALFFNLLAFSLGFGVLITSIAPPLIHFGTLVAVAVTFCFITSMTLLPALIYILKPKFIMPPERFKNTDPKNDKT